ncbi:hypothetical protein E4T49_01791 [Aureobasidium sp. EXF-10728]|nr:hypothetical protein E4T49_01791 [Aureobasidium sp. EXF-10728]
MAAIERPEKQLASMLDRLHENGAYSDMKIVCSIDSYNVHKAIICPQSDFFRNACRLDTFAEGKIGVIDITAGLGRDSQTKLTHAPEEVDWVLDVETRTSVKLMIHYFYHHNYPERNAENAGSFLQHTRMYAMGAKYAIPGLKDLALARFSRPCDGNNTVQNLMSAAVIAYSRTQETDKRLREAIVTVFDANRRAIKDLAWVSKIVSKLPELAFELYLKSVKRELSLES